MAVLPPLYRQQKSDSCALACLRMILAHHGNFLDEKTLEEGAHKQQGGVAIDALVNLAERYSLSGVIETLDLNAIAAYLADGVFPIVYLNRVHISKRPSVTRRLALRRCIVHAVIPVRISPHYVTFHDPRGGLRRRISRRKFEAAQRDLSNWCVVCRPA